MAASIMCWAVPKLAADFLRHWADFRNVWTRLREETLIVQENTIAFKAIMRLMEEIEVGKTINPAWVTRVWHFATYDLTAGSWTVFFELPAKQSPYVPADFKRAPVIPTSSPSFFSRSTYICIVFCSGDAWKKTVSHSPSRVAVGP